MISSCCTLRLNRRRAFSSDSFSWIIIPATQISPPFLWPTVDTSLVHVKEGGPNGLLCASSNQAAIRSQALFFRRQEFAGSGQGPPRAGQGGPGSLSEP